MKRAPFVLYCSLICAMACTGPARGGDTAPTDSRDENALTLTREFAEFGDMAAQFNLATAYEFGIGVPQDHAQAVYWYQKAAEQGLAVAQSNLGVMYAEGKGIARDLAQAVYWYEQAARQGDAKAQNNLGAEYYRGRVIARDDVLAYKWWSLAARQGNANAQRNLKTLEASLSAAQLADAQASLARHDTRAARDLRSAKRTGVFRSGRCHKSAGLGLPPYPCFYD